MITRQYGFYFDADRCIQCRTCETACQSVHNIEPGIKWRQVIQGWFGEFPDIRTLYFSRACMHCGKPACEAVCPTGAIIKRTEDGIVVVDKEKCNGCQECLSACPFDIPQFGSDRIMQKCDFCLGLGIEPNCAVHCPTGALKFGTMEQLTQMTAGKTLEKLPESTEASLIIFHKSDVKIIDKLFPSL
jgi:Fe-S-cluster-containing dehydrogenase component